MSPIKEANLSEPFETWWRALTLKGDPALRYYLTQEAFIAGYEAAQSRIYRSLAEELLSRSKR